MNIFFHKFYRAQIEHKLRLARIEIRQDEIKAEAAERKRLRVRKPSVALTTMIVATATIASGI